MTEETKIEEKSQVPEVPIVEQPVIEEKAKEDDKKKKEDEEEEEKKKIEKKALEDTITALKDEIASLKQSQAEMKSLLDKPMFTSPIEKEVKIEVKSKPINILSLCR